MDAMLAEIAVQARAAGHCLECAYCGRPFTDARKPKVSGFYSDEVRCPGHGAGERYSLSADLLLSRLEAVKRTDQGRWIASCPAYRRFGLRAVYCKEDLDAWAAAKLTAPRNSTAAA